MAQTSKPRRFKALLASFLKGLSPENVGQGKTDPFTEESSTDSPSKGDVADAPDGYVVVDEWPLKKKDQPSTVQPQNRQHFFKRVETFSTSSWFAKPPEVSPLHCAQYGWENIGDDSLKCVSCKEVVYGGLPPRWERTAYQTASKKLREALENGHSKICPWQSNPSPASFREVEFVSQSEAVDAFLQRVSSLRCFSTDIPDVNRSVLAEVDKSEDVLLGLVTGVLGEEPTADYKDRIQLVCLMALCGWARSSPENSKCPVMSCEYCRRNIGLWNFTKFQESETEVTAATEESPEPAAKKLKLRPHAQVDKGSFHPLEEHRAWCPWVKPTPSSHQPVRSLTPQQQAQTPSRPAWQELLAILQRRCSPQKQANDGPLTNKQVTPPSQAWKAVRKITNFWQSKGAAHMTGEKG